MENMKHNRTWLAFANENYCNHRKALKEIGLISWTKNIRANFAVNDIVYLFMSDDRAVRFKLRVCKVDVPREDSKYWIIKAPKDSTYQLKLEDEYDGILLNEEVLVRVGFKGGGSILTPNCNNTELIDYVNSVFEIASSNEKLPSHYIVVDLGSGSYCQHSIGHEVFNLEPNEIDGRFYGYLPPYDNPNIVKLGTSVANGYVDGVMVVYVQKVPASNNRKIVGFTDKARVYAHSQHGSVLNRFIVDGGKRIECTYTIESDYIYDLRSEPDSFVFEVRGKDSQMFRNQRFYIGRHPKQEVKMLQWLIDYIQRKSQENDYDLDFQKEIQEVEADESLTNTFMRQPSYNNGKSGKTVAKKACVSKQALKKANFKCEFDGNHDTFLTNKGVPYMEGHHLIPCTSTNSDDYWTKYKRNIDCVENIVCLCPTCHRRIHFGSNEEKDAIIRFLYQKQISLLRAAGLEISIERLRSFYNLH